MTIKLDVLIIQLINIGILFWLFKKFIGGFLVQEIKERKELMKKLENAEEAFKERIQDAEKEAANIIAQTMEKKDHIIAEAGAIATKRQNEILENAEQRATNIIHDAEKRAKVMGDDLEKNFIQWVKQAAYVVVKKLINEDKTLEDKYIQTAIKDLQKN